MPGLETDDEDDEDIALHAGTFLQEVTVDKLETALGQAQKAVKHALSAPRPSTSSDPAVDALSLILKSRVSGLVKDEVATVQHSVIHTKVLGWTIQAEQLLFDLLLWEWLERQVEDSWRQNVRDIGPHGSSKLFGLMHTIDNLLAGHARTHNLDASNFLSDFAPGQAQYALTVPKRRYSSADDSSVLFDYTFQILADWMGLPDSKKSMPKAWYARELIDRVGIHALSLRAVTKAANQSRSSS
ncbi:hypothetical protein NLJ89_g12346 [Agrocybe chaxingu]|uniref:Uncharacterized protein n=1 Tax=Agrocybe chaxingu TaxID=84603 RepID=A0A9W8JUL7_9AGAR|nr:hypothetical protein NLJ89_g12346 [Agrocybe chaxingu]